MLNKKELYQLLKKNIQILSEVDKISQKAGHPKRFFIRQTLRDNTYLFNELEKEIKNDRQ